MTGSPQARVERTPAAGARLQARSSSAAVPALPIPVAPRVRGGRAAATIARAQRSTFRWFQHPIRLGVGVTILDAGGALEQSSLCQVDCESCTRNPCPPLPCLQPEALTDSGIALSWSGMYLASSSCGSASTSCASTRCAAPGQYQVQACGFVNANPSSSDGCLVSSYRDYTCVLVSFDYPPPAGAPVVIAMPAQP